MVMASPGLQEAMEEALLEAALHNQHDALKLLLDRHVARDPALHQALVQASSRGHLEIVQLLIQVRRAQLLQGRGFPLPKTMHQSICHVLMRRASKSCQIFCTFAGAWLPSEDGARPHICSSFLLHCELLDVAVWSYTLYSINKFSFAESTSWRCFLRPFCDRQKLAATYCIHS
jgi:hypothetical protein